MLGNIQGSYDDTLAKEISDLKARVGVLEGYRRTMKNPTILAFNNKQDNQGIMIQFEDQNQTKMMYIEIAGNGYTLGNPVKALIQGYHYLELGEFLSCKQTILSGNTIIGRCTFGIYENKISLWVPVSGTYNTFIITTYEGNPYMRMNYHTSRIFYEKPGTDLFTKQVNCTIVKDT